MSYSSLGLTPLPKPEPLKFEDGTEMTPQERKNRQPQKSKETIEIVDFTPIETEPPKETKSDVGSVTAGDFGKTAASGLVGGIGASVRGVGEAVTDVADSDSVPEAAWKFNKMTTPLLMLYDKMFGQKREPIKDNVFEKPAAWLEGKAKGLEESRSQAAKLAEKNSTPTGNLLTLEGISLGEDPSLTGYALQGTKLLGQIFPQIVFGLATRGMGTTAQLAGGAAISGSQGAGFAAQQARETIGALSDKELESQSERYRELLSQGMGNQEARRIVTRETERLAAKLTAPVSMAGGAATQALIGKPGEKLLQNIAAGTVARTVAGGAIGAAEEGVQELGEGIATNVGINQGARGDIVDIGEGSFGNLVLGAVGGAPVGAVRGALTRSPKEQETSAPLDAETPDAVPTNLALPAPERSQALPPPDTVEQTDWEVVSPEQRQQLTGNQRPEAVGYSDAPTDIVVDGEGNARPLNREQQQNLNTSRAIDADLGLTPDVRRAQSFYLRSRADAEAKAIGGTVERVGDKFEVRPPEPQQVVNFEPGFDAAQTNADNQGGEAQPKNSLVNEEQAGIAPSNTLSRDSSWIIRNKESGEVVMETFDRNKVNALNTEKYEAVPALQYLQELNSKIKQEAQAKPTAEPLPELSRLQKRLVEKRAARAQKKISEGGKLTRSEQKSLQYKQAEASQPKLRDANAKEVALANRAPDELDLQRKPTGWKAVPIENGDGTVLVSKDGKKAITFANPNPSSGADALRARAMAQAYAIDNPYQAQAETPQGELEIKPIFKTGESAPASMGTEPGKNKEPEPEQKKQSAKKENPAKEKPAKEKSDSQKIEDFGEKLGGARKDTALSFRKSLSDEDIASLPLSKIWPLDEIDAIEDIFVAAVASAARAEIPVKPRQPYKLKTWVEKVQTLRGLVSDISSEKYTRERFINELGKSRTLRDLLNKILLLEKIDREQWSRIGKVNEYPESYHYDDSGKKILEPIVYIEIDDKTRRYSAKSSLDVLDKINEALGKQIEAKRMQFDVRVSSKTNDFYINKKGDPERRKLKSFKSSKEAFEYIKNNYDDLVAAWDSVKERDNVKETDTRNNENRPRTGQDRRNGKDVTPDQFVNTFGFRGVEFGNWVSQGKSAKERQGMLNEAYDALMDLSDIVGVPPKAISLNGTLGLGFGSRGQGWASAHFEPSNLVINLTKTKGAGALAHEWFHALDNYFSRKRGGEKKIGSGLNAQKDYRDNNYITHKPEALYIHKTERSQGITRARLMDIHKKNPKIAYYDPANWIPDPKHPLGVRPQVEKAFSDLVQTLNDSPMLLRSRSIDKGKEGYWSRTLEIAARAFENYVISQMKAKGYQNDYLANVKEVDDFPRAKERYPYLLPEEIAPVAQAFDNLFSVMEAKEDAAGNVALESRRAFEPEDTKLTIALSMLAEDDAAFSYPVPMSKDLSGIAQEIDPDYKVKPLSPSTAKEKNAKQAWEISVPGSQYRSGYLYDDGKTVWIDVARLQEGADAGSKIYAMAAGYAVNNRRLFKGDPAGLSKTAFFRRTEAMISSILKYGTSDHLMPHEAQVDPMGYYGQEDFDFANSVRPVDWKAGETAHNLKELLYTSWKYVSDRVPEIKNVFYDFDQQRFFKDGDDPAFRRGRQERGGESGRSDTTNGRSGDYLFQDLANTAQARSAKAGSRTLKRAAFINTVLRETRGTGRDGWNRLLAGISGQLSGRLAAPLRKIFYSRNQQQAPASSGLSASEARKFTNDFLNKFPGAKRLNVEVLARQDIPENFRPSSVYSEAVYYPPNRFSSGKLYIIPEAIPSAARLEQVLLHETVGHYGLESLLGDKFADVMADVKRLQKAKGKVTGKEKPGDTNYATVESVQKLYPDYSEFDQMREVMARMAETGVRQTWFYTLLNKIKAALRKMGIDIPLSSSDLKQMLVDAANKLRQAEGGRADTSMELKPSLSRERLNAPFYSALQKAVGDLNIKTAGAESWKQQINALIGKKDVKADEIEWSGINEWLDLQQGKITKDQVLEYLRGNGVRVEEIEKRSDVNKYGSTKEDYYLAGEPSVYENDDGTWTGELFNNTYITDAETEQEAWDVLRAEAEDGWRQENGSGEEEGQTKYGRYTLPGGKNYREVLLTLPDTRTPDQKRTAAEAIQEAARIRAEGARGANFVAQVYDDIASATKKDAASYKSSHWEQPNVLAHIRVNDRTDADGKRVLFVEEIQSDWGQEGKKKGFGVKDKTPLTKAEDDELMALYELRDRRTAEQSARMNALNDRLNASQGKGGIPVAPFVTATDKWLTLALKRIITMAAQEGYDRVAFVNGEQSAERYDLSKQIDRVAITKTGGVWAVNAWKDGQKAITRDAPTDSELANLVGKELAERAIKDGGGEYAGLDLKVGGEGMKAFYDKIVPNAVKALLKKLDGGQLKAIQISRADAKGIGEQAMKDAGRPATDWYDLSDDERAEIYRKYRNQSIVQPGFDITPAMREKAVAGLPLFSRKAAGFDGPEIGNTPIGDMTEIEVDGKMRPALNSNGKPIHPTQEGVRNFWKWFGDSKVVDDQGRPLVVYHGTPNSFSRFDTFPAFFTTDADAAVAYAENQYARDDTPDDVGPNVMPAYLSLKNPVVLTEAEAMQQIGEDSGRIDWSAVDEFAYQSQKKGSDGIIIRGAVDYSGGQGANTQRRRYDQYIAFSPTQIKSATGNSGAFDPVRPSILESRRAPEGWQMTDGSKFDDFVYKFQDKQIDLKRAINAIREENKALDDKWDAYLKEELFHGRAAKRTQDFVNEELNPLIEQMKQDGLTLDEVDLYLHARHAKEANALIAKRDSGLKDGGSGMTNAEADNYFRGLDANKKQKLDKAAKKVDAILESTRQMIVDYQLESDQTIKGWKDMFKHYVPLMREDEGSGSTGTGQGYSIKGREVKHRTGSTKNVVNILANIAMQRERTIVRGEKNRVALSVAGLAKLNPNPDVWKVDAIPVERVFNEKTGMVEERKDQLFKQRDNVFVAKFIGKSGQLNEVAVIFNERNDRAMRMVESLKNLDATRLSGAMGFMASVTRYFSAVNTQYNPIFGAVNLTRDVQGAAINLSSTPIADKKLQVIRQTPAAIAGIYRDVRGQRKGRNPNNQWSKLWDEFQAMGGATGFRDMFATSDDRAKAIKSALDPTAWTKSTLGKIFTADGLLKVPLVQAQKQAKWLFDWLSDYNLTLENGVRLAAYKVALEQGLSKERAASLAKNLTVNFNRKGQVTLQAGALYAFFNASIQGNARMAQVLFNVKDGKFKNLKLTGIGKSILTGGVLIGAIQPLLLAAAGFGDDEPPEFVRERNLVIPIGGKKYITVPMPLGWHVLPNFGRLSMEYAMSGFEGGADKVIQMMTIVADSFNPIGNSGLSYQTIAPTAFDPLVALSENRDWTGKPIAREAFNQQTPGHMLAKDAASSFGIGLSTGINWITGGSQYSAGTVSPTPDQIDYLIGQLTGGVGREITKVDQTARALIAGEELPPNKIPLLGRFYGNAASSSAQAGKFYENVNVMRKHELEIKGRLKNSEPIDDYQSKNPESVLWAQAAGLNRAMMDLNNRKRELVKSDAPRDEVKAIEKQMTALMTNFNNQVEALKRKAKEPSN